jgi:hypothetical protein
MLIKKFFENQFILGIVKNSFCFTLTLKETKGISNWFLCKNGIHPKVLRIYPKAIIPYEEMYEDLIRRDIPLYDMEEATIKRMYRRFVGFEFPWCQKVIYGGLYDDK